MQQDVEASSDCRPAEPLRLAMRNSGMALLPIAGAGVAYAIRFRELIGNVHWWVWGAVVVGVVAVCFAHTGLAMRIGMRRANQVGLVFLFIVLATIILWLTRTIETGRSDGR